jgi:hypothetical protein
MKVQHATAVCLDDTEMVRNFPEDSNAPSIGIKETFENSLTRVVEEFSDSNKIRRSCRLANGSCGCRQVVSGISVARQV